MVPQSVLLVPMPAVDRVIDRYRRRLDHTRRYAMPAHVTVLFPFAPPAALSDDVRAELTDLFAGIEAFAFTLSDVRWFEDRVVYLAPEPAARFRALTAAAVARFPGYLPYEGAFEEVVPHVTVGSGAPRVLMRAAARVVERRLPLSATATEVSLMAIGDPDPTYRVVGSFPLGGSAPSGGSAPPSPSGGSAPPSASGGSAPPTPYGDAGGAGR